MSPFLICAVILFATEPTSNPTLEMAAFQCYPKIDRPYPDTTCKSKKAPSVLKSLPFSTEKI